VAAPSGPVRFSDLPQTGSSLQSPQKVCLLSVRQVIFSAVLMPSRKPQKRQTRCFVHEWRSILARAADKVFSASIETLVLHHMSAVRTVHMQQWQNAGNISSWPPTSCPIRDSAPRHNTNCKNGFTSRIDRRGQRDL
jgi:hypothetical protein